jgi:hypothetical protein
VKLKQWWLERTSSQVNCNLKTTRWRLVYGLTAKLAYHVVHYANECYHAWNSHKIDFKVYKKCRSTEVVGREEVDSYTQL